MPHTFHSSTSVTVSQPEVFELMSFSSSWIKWSLVWIGVSAGS